MHGCGNWFKPFATNATRLGHRCRRGRCGPAPGGAATFWRRRRPFRSDVQPAACLIHTNGAVRARNRRHGDQECCLRGERPGSLGRGSVFGAYLYPITRYCILTFCNVVYDHFCEDRRRFWGDLRSLKIRPQNAISLRSKTQPADRKSTRLNSSHSGESRMPSSA